MTRVGSVCVGSEIARSFAVAAQVRLAVKGMTRVGSVCVGSEIARSFAVAAQVGVAVKG